ncbi:hypothetical protein IC614_09610 [Allosphingosinicella flava]|uniref:Uncharacterized protein n=1 Tax=Allosphingosinicella flava TaxID=2771430 RepID=A0A7T2LLJ4_9SPHN|nr:hypothetical protein [Sphingosinicella flava]QPQ54580.1 hypothetical protein IC614_09610 [Sphingosinicella flava]
MTTRGLKKTLSNPFALVAQGFAMGSLLVWVTIPADAQAQDLARTTEIAAPPTR